MSQHRSICAAIIMVVAMAGSAWSAPATRPFAAAEDLIVLQAPTEKADGSMPTLLERELMRQALLICARDRLGLYTFDQVLREPGPSAAGDLSRRTVGLKVTLDHKPLRLHLDFTAGGAASEGVEIAVPSLKPGITDLSRLAVAADVESHKDFFHWLTDAGFVAKPQSADFAGVVPEDMEARLSDMSVTAQYDAVRRLHAIIEVHGASPELLSALTRGYANLGQLTRFHWNAAADVFTARSLLYTQEILSEDHSSALGHWSNAYALAMAGLHAAAMDECQAARAAGKDAPNWTQPIDPLCRYDTAGLNEIARKAPALAGPALYMAYLTVESCASPSLILKVGDAALESNPLCERIIDSMCDGEEFNLTRKEMHETDKAVGIDEDYNEPAEDRLTKMGLAVGIAELRQELPLIADLPEPVRRASLALNAQSDVNVAAAEVGRALVETSDGAEPSWSCLGRMLQDADLIHAYRRAWLSSQGDAIDAPDGFLNDLEALAKGHPLAVTFDAYSSGRDDAAMTAERRATKFVDPTYRVPMLMRYDTLLPQKRWDSYFASQEHHLNPTAYDYERGLLYAVADFTDQPNAVAHARQLMVISPYSPVGPAALIRRDWKNSAAHVDEWSARFAGQVAFDGQLARQYAQHGEWRKAIDVLKRYVTAAQDWWAYELLAKAYLQIGDEADWQATMEAWLKCPEQRNLDHDETQMEIAQHLIGEGKFQQAQPFAEAAASNDLAKAAMHVAALCDVALGDWDGALRWFKKLDEVQGPDFEWYIACRISGRGDLAAARMQAQMLIAMQQNDPNAGVGVQYGDRESLRLSMAVYYAAEGDVKEETDALESEFSQSGEPFLGLWLATVYDRANDTVHRDEALKQTVERGEVWEKAHKQATAEQVELAQMLQEAIATPDGRIDLDKFNAKFKALPPDRLGRLDYVAGEFLEHRGDVAHGLQMIQFTAAHAPYEVVFGNLARIELQDAKARLPASSTSAK